MSTTVLSTSSVDAEVFERAPPPEPTGDGGNAVSTRSARSTSRMRARARVDRAEVAAQGVTGDLGDLTRQLDAGWAAADDREREPGPAAVWIRLDFGRFERGEDAAADLNCVFEA